MLLKKPRSSLCDERVAKAGGNGGPLCRVGCGCYAGAGAGVARKLINRRMFCAVAAINVCSATFQSLRKRNRRNLITVLSSANSTSTFLRSRHDRQYASVPQSSLVRWRAGSSKFTTRRRPRPAVQRDLSGHAAQSFGEALYVYTLDARPMPRYVRSLLAGQRYALIAARRRSRRA